jgi:hypothetical protein
MVYPTDINRNVFLYVEEARYDSSDSTPCWYLYGWSFDSWFGFGGEFEHEGYEGEVAIISETSKSIKFLDIGRHHSSSKSWGWWIETEELPEPPFLITNRLSTKLIFNGIVELELNEDGKETFYGERDPAWVGTPISFQVLGSSGWFGVIEKLEESDSFSLLAYSDSLEKEGILNSEMIANYDVANAMDKLMRDEEVNVKKFNPFGKIIRLLSQPETSLSHA